MGTRSWLVIVVVLVAAVVSRLALRSWLNRGRRPSGRPRRGTKARLDAEGRNRLGRDTVLLTHESDPRVSEARQRALETFLDFMRLAIRNPERALIKTALDLGEDGVHVFWTEFLGPAPRGRLRIRFLPTGSGFVPPDPERMIEVDRVADWMCVTPDGKVHGAFTERANIVNLRERNLPLSEFHEWIARSLADPWMPS